MEYNPRDSEMVYGADMCNRRLRGVKVNPIYQEKDMAAGSSEVDPSQPVGEIQIDMYESLPRKRRILKYSPDAILLSSTNNDGHTVIEWKYPAQTSASANNCDTCSSSNNASLHPNNSPQSHAPDCVCGKSLNIETYSPSDGTAISHIWDNSSPASKEKTFDILNDDNGVDVDGDDRTAMRDSDPRHHNDVISIRGCGTIEEQEEDCNNSSTSSKSSSTSHFQCNSETEKAILSNEDGKSLTSSADAIVAYATIEHSTPRNIYSVSDFSGDLSDTEFSLKHSNKFLNDLDYITSHTIPVCPIDVLNNNHQTVPDQMVSILLHDPKQADDIASIKALHQSLSSPNSFDKSLCKNEEKTNTDVNGLKSNTNTSGCNCHGKPSLKCPCGRLALQKLLKQKHFFGKAAHDSNSDTATRNSDKEFDENSNTTKCTSTEHHQTNRHDTRQNEESVLQELDNSFEKELNDSSSGVPSDTEEAPTILVDLGPDATTSKSILISRRRGSKIRECRPIQFAKDTIFNENSRRTKYAKERRRPVDVVSDSIQLDHLTDGGPGLQGYDNPVFVCDEDIPDSVFFDETSFTNGVYGGNDILTNGKHSKGSKKKNKTSGEILVTELLDGSIILKPEDLNMPAYLDNYIRSFNNNNNKTCDQFGKKAPPVSIEALGGMTVADLADIEVAKDDCDYKRRRRKNNAYGYYDEGSAFLRKEQRVRNLKVGIIVFVIFAVICTAIGLGVHFGGGANSTVLAATDAGSISGLPQSQQKALLDRAKASQNVAGFAGPLF